MEHRSRADCDVDCGQMIQANPALTPGAVKNILISTADRIATQPAIRQGYGVVNARRAVELAQTERHTPERCGMQTTSSGEWPIAVCLS